MAQYKSYALGETCENILAELVDNGRFETKSEALRAGIRLLADHEAQMSKLRSIQKAIDIADEEIEQGLGTEYKNADDLTRKIIASGKKRLNKNS